MRMFLTIVGVYAIASVIGALAFVLLGYVMKINEIDFKTSWGAYALICLISLPFAYIGNNWLYRFGIVKGMVAIHLLLWLGFIAFVNVASLIGSGGLLTDVSFYIYSFLIYLLPITLGAIIMNWIIYGTQGLFQFKKKLMVRVKPPKTLDFAEYGKWVVVGQDYAIDTIQKVLTANTKLADRGDPRRNRILASFLFVGPTGVGKTETAKALASWLSQEGYGYLRIDANQFSFRESTWTLLGSPKGYIGSETPGLLPDAVSRNPKQVILIDEIEKADQGFYQFLLQLLDEGYVIERSTGYAYYLNRAIVIITSNLENQRIAEIMETLSDPVEIDIAVRKTLESAKISFGGGRTFRITPEFLGRIDAVIPFRSLGFEDLVQIAYRELRRLGENVSIDFARALTQKYYPIAKEYGVRYFLKKVQEEVLTQ
jgi:ATPases with chaperone activity, ATP-binding subunit